MRSPKDPHSVSLFEVFLVRMWENMDQKNSEYGYFSLSTYLQLVSEKKMRKQPSVRDEIDRSYILKFNSVSISGTKS